jgi:hypothetical protein
MGVWGASRGRRREGERQALIQNMAKRLSMHGKLLLSEIPIYRVNTLHNCFCDPSLSHHPFSLPFWWSHQPLCRPREGPLLWGPSSLHPLLWPGRGKGSPRLPARKLGAERWGRRRVLKAEGAGARARGGVCFGPRPGMQKRGGGGSGGPRAGVWQPRPLCPGELHRHGRERALLPGSGPEAPAGSGAQSVPGTWGLSRRGINKKE